MSFPISIIVFILAIGVVITASVFLYTSLIKVGAFFHCPERFLGLTAAFAADAAEILSAFTAFHIGQHELGFGIILGSNIFNLASMLGISALLTGALKFNHQEMLVHGAVSLIAAVICILLVLEYIPPWLSLLLLAILLIPYFVLLSPSRKIIKELPVTPLEEKFLKKALKDVGKAEPPPRSVKELIVNMALSLVSLFGIFIGCVGVVQSGVLLGVYLNISKVIMGTVIIAILTSIPNMLTMIPFAYRKREMALISGALNSNTLNILLGICLPSVFYGIGIISGKVVFSLYWLLGMTAFTLILGYCRKGLFRLEGAVIVGLYVVFLSILISMSS